MLVQIQSIKRDLACSFMKEKQEASKNSARAFSRSELQQRQLMARSVTAMVQKELMHEFTCYDAKPLVLQRI